MKIVTKTGDKGETSLIGGERVSKDDPHLAACGSIDELSAILGVCLSLAPPSPWCEELEEIQRTLFLLAADLASPELSTNFHLTANHV
ncbi:TPA: ATP:cob(I)alamin adenosyltransferase, partial [bacterium UBP9_UBA11836]|nr:ATP:cob(I)alamin adenosyltransferase [bacterium UBP9_UBA11836]